MGGDSVGRGVALPDEMIGDVDEVGEGVLLAQQLAVVVPLATHLLATADVGDGVDHAAVEQADRRRAEGRVDRVSVAAVGVLQQRGLAVLLEALRSEEHTSELRSLMRLSYAVLCLHKK